MIQEAQCLDARDDGDNTACFSPRRSLSARVRVPGRGSGSGSGNGNGSGSLGRDWPWLPDQAGELKQQRGIGSVVATTTAPLASEGAPQTAAYRWVLAARRCPRRRVMGAHACHAETARFSLEPEPTYLTPPQPAQGPAGARHFRLALPPGSPTNQRRAHHTSPARLSDQSLLAHARGP